MEAAMSTGEDSLTAASSPAPPPPSPPPPPPLSPAPTSRPPAASQARPMEAPTGLHRLRGPSPIVWAMRTRVAPPPRLAEPIPRPVYPPAPPPQAPLPERRRRGRPRKVACLPPPPGLGPPPGFAPSPAARPSPAATAHGHGDLGGLQPHVLTIAAGEDIIARVMAVSQLNSKAICILSALGSVKEAVLVQPSGVILTHKGPLEIIRLSGSILTSNNDHRCLRITLASVNSFVISGIIAGPLIAETPVQAILGSFHNSAFYPNNAPRATMACYPNKQAATGNGSTLPSHRSNPHSASRTSVEQNESSDIDVKPFVGLGNPNPEYASRTSMEQRESYMAILGSFHSNLFSPNNAPRAAIACYPNTQGATGNGSTLPSDRSKLQYASRTPVGQNESSEVDIKPFFGLLNPNPEYTSRTPVERNEPDEVDVKPFVGLVNPNPEYAFHASVEQNEPDEVDVKPFIGVVSPNPGHASFTSAKQNESSEIDVEPSLGVA